MATSDAAPRLRPAVRAIMIDPRDRVLLVKLHLANDWAGWVLPGGGIEPGEDTVVALQREIAEETGATSQAFIGPVVARRRHIKPGMVKGWDGQEETFYLVPCHEFEIAPQMDKDLLRAEGVVDVTWWTLADLGATGERVVPDGLADLIAHLLEHGAPDEPVMIELIEPADG